MAKSSFLQDFKEFAMKGNVVDMAVGVVIGGAFGKIVTSIVGDIIMPLVGLIAGGVNFSDLKVQLSPEQLDAEGNVIKEAATLNWGMFVQNCIVFLIIAFSIYLVIRLIAKFNRKKEEAPAPEPEPAPSKEEVLLSEIRDLLKNK